jgi:hypothetical protein
MTPEAVGNWFTLIKDGGLLLITVLLLVSTTFAYFKRWVVPGWLLTERDKRIATLEGEVIQWRTLALQSIGMSARFAAVATQAEPQSVSSPMLSRGGD